MKEIMVLANVVMAGLMLSAVAARFLYTSVSLEGMAFWIVRSSPVGMRSFPWSKFLYNYIPLSLLIVLLVLPTNTAPHRGGFMMLLSLATTLMLCISINGLGTGFGAMYPHFRYHNIASVSMSLGGMAFMPNLSGSGDQRRFVLPADEEGREDAYGCTVKFTADVSTLDIERAVYKIGLCRNGLLLLYVEMNDGPVFRDIQQLVSASFYKSGECGLCGKIICDDLKHLPGLHTFKYLFSLKEGPWTMQPLSVDYHVGFYLWHDFSSIKVKCGIILTGRRKK